MSGTKRRLRLSLGWKEVDIIENALLFYVENWRDDDERDLAPWERESLNRAVAANQHILRERIRQDFRS